MMLSAVLLIIISGCTRNNGDIGSWFGRWQVMEIQADGVSENDFRQQYFWEFQNNIIHMIWVGPEGYDHDIYECFGTWKELDGNAMQMDFSHSDDDGTQDYRPFGIFHFPDDAPFTLTIASQSGNDCNMKYTDPDSGIEYTYILRKR